MLATRILEHARRTPEAIALVHNGVAWSYAAFARWIAICRNAFEQANVRHGGVAVICIDRLGDAWAAALAMRSLGVTTVAVDGEMDIPGLGLRDVQCVVTLGTRPDLDVEALAAKARWPCIRTPPRPRPDEACGPAPALPESTAGHILLTSGTTGVSKKVLWDARAEAARAPTLAQVFGITGTSAVYIGAFPPWTAGGHRWSYITWFAGGTVVFQQSPEMHLPFRDRRVTHAFATPATLGNLLCAPADAFSRNDELRLFVTAGALPRALAREAKSRLTRQVFTALASTEASVLSMTLVGDDEDLYWHRVLASRTVQVVDESGRELPAGETGLVRTVALDGITGYLDDEAASREFFRDGYFYPGDIGEFRQDGRLRLHGRATDVINVRGTKIATGQIEQALQDRLGVEGVCLFSMQDEEAGEEIHVAIQSRRPIDRAALAAIAQSELGAFPRAHFHVLESLPRNTMGKVRRFALKQQVLAKRRPAEG